MTVTYPSPSLADAALAVVALLERGHVRETEVATAFLALWLLQRVETGATTREQADDVFTVLDASVSRDLAVPLSATWRELVTEAEHLHHLGDEWGADPTELRRLANAILEREPATREAGTVTRL